MAFVGRRSKKSYRKRHQRRGKRNYRSRRYNRRHAPSPSAVNFAPFGNTHSVSHRYVETVSIDPVQSLVGSYCFSANGMYDPNITGIGHQPYGFDQLNAFYDHYCVTGAKITVKTANSSQLYPFYIGIALRDNTSNLTGTGIDNMLEQPGVKKVLVGLDGAPKTISMGFSARKFFTVKDVVGEDELNGTGSANPVEGAFFHLVMIPFEGNHDLSSQNINVTIDYHAVWSEPKIAAQS